MEKEEIKINHYTLEYIGLLIFRPAGSILVGQRNKRKKKSRGELKNEGIGELFFNFEMFTLRQVTFHFKEL